MAALLSNITSNITTITSPIVNAIPFPPSSSSFALSLNSNKINLKVKVNVRTKPLNMKMTTNEVDDDDDDSLSFQNVNVHHHLLLRSKNPHIIHRHLRRLSHHDRLPSTLPILDYLQARGIPVDPTTFSSLLSSCSRLKSLSIARILHAHILSNSLHHNEFILQRLVHTYASCGSLQDARKVFDGMPRSVFTWNALLKGNAVNGRRWSSTPLDVFQEMRQAGVQLNEYTFSSLIKSFAGSPTFFQGTKVHALMIKKGFYNGFLMLQTGLIDMYFKCGRVMWALKVFHDTIPAAEPEVRRDAVLWGTVIAGFAHNKLKREALEYMRMMVREGVEPNPVIFTTVLPVIGDLSERKLGQEIHGYVMKQFRDYKDMVFVQSSLVDMYCKSRDMVSGRHVFYETAGRNAVSWTALLSGYASNGRLEQALRSIMWMQKEGIKPDALTISTILPVCKQLKALRQGKEIHAYSLKNWFLPNVFISAALMTVYSECGMLNLSCRVFEDMKKKNVIAWTALIDSYIKNERLIDALKIFRYMRLLYHRPDAVALSRVLSISGDLGALKIGKEVHGQVYKMNMESTPFLIAEIVRMYGKNGDIESAKKVFDGVHSKGSLTCTSIIEACGLNGRYKEAIKLFGWMKSKGFVPNHFTFDAILDICEKAEFVDEALDVFDYMVRKYKLKVTEEHCDCIIGLLTRAGRLSEVQSFNCLKSSLAQM